MFMKAIALAFATLLRFAQGGDPINDPYDAAIVAAEVTGLNDRMRDTYHDGMPGATWLVATGMVESRLTDVRGKMYTHGGKKRLYAPTAIHKVDAWLGEARYKWSVKHGRLRPKTCAYHKDDGHVKHWRRKPYARWATRGPYGMVVADKFVFVAKWIGTDCFPVEWFDVPLINALAAAEHAKATCDRWGRYGRRKPCDASFMRCIWAGVGKCQDVEYRKRVHRNFTKWTRRARRRMRVEGDIRTTSPVHVITRRDELPSPPPRPHDEW